ncbi:hypothetical protein R6Q57_027707 [Mikania cordata]
MGRSPACCEKKGLKKGPWTSEEDQKLIHYIQNSGYGNWRTLPGNAGLQRCGKSCRLRWINYLRPDIKRGRFSFEEEEAIIQLHSVLGNKWSAIAARLPGRTDNEIKNYWNTRIRKKLLGMGIDPVTHTPRLDLQGVSSFYSSPHKNMFGIQPVMNPELLRFAASLLSSQHDPNRNLLRQNGQENLFEHPHQVQENSLVQLQNQDNQNLFQQVPGCASLNNSNCVSFGADESAQLMEPNVHQLASSFYDFDQETCHINDWLYDLDNFIANEGNQQKIISHDSNFTLNEFDFPPPLSNLSTPSSSPVSQNPNSPSCINGSSIISEDEREISYFSSFFKYEYQ